MQAAPRSTPAESPLTPVPARSPAEAFVLPAMLLAVALAPLLAFNLTPNATLFNQLAALAGWGAVLLLLPPLRSPAGADGMRRGGDAAQLALLLLLAAALASPLWTGLPLSLSLSGAALLAAAWWVLSAATRLDVADARHCWGALCWALLVAGVASVAVSLVQVFAPALADGTLIARSGIAGRAVGNLRQPNHLSSLMLWSAIAAVWLAEAGRLGAPQRARWLLPALLFAFVFTIVMSASRTGMIGVLLLLAWGALDRQLSRPARAALLATPLMLAASWGLMSAWAHLGEHAFGAESRLAEGAGSPSRVAILRNTWALLQMHPWTGVGWGEFNLAWSMTPFPDRPIAFFDHCHNLPMQLLVELGWPLGGAVLALLGWALWRAWREAAQAEGDRAHVLRAALLLLLAIGLHSLLEYPLWYAYFLLPTAFALGIALGGREARAEASASPLRWKVGGAMLIAGSAFAAADYLRVVAIYAPPAKPAPLAQRVERGQRGVFFTTQADYAAATSFGRSAEALEATRRTAHNLIDQRLMMHWAQTLHAQGDTERARHVVQRLREFRPSGAQAEWLAGCEDLSVTPRPWQCLPPQRDYRWQELR
jgi:O-antigen ligase